MRAAKGMPLKDIIPVFPLIPLTIPSVVFTVVEIGSDIFFIGIRAKELKRKRKNTGPTILIFMFRCFFLRFICDNPH